MAYATYDDLVAKYGEDFVLLCFDRIGIGSPDEATVNANLADASALIDSYLTIRYDVPIDPVPPILLAICRDIAVYYGSPDYASGLTDEKRRRYEDARAWLQSVKDGDADLGGTDETAAPADSRSIVRMSTQPTLFTRRTLAKVF